MQYVLTLITRLLALSEHWLNLNEDELSCGDSITVSIMLNQFTYHFVIISLFVLILIFFLLPSSIDPEQNSLQ